MNPKRLRTPALDCNISQHELRQLKLEITSYSTKCIQRSFKVASFKRDYKKLQINLSRFGNSCRALRVGETVCGRMLDKKYCFRHMLMNFVNAYNVPQAKHQTRQVSSSSKTTTNSPKLNCVKFLTMRSVRASKVWRSQCS